MDVNTHSNLHTKINFEVKRKKINALCCVITREQISFTFVCACPLLQMLLH